MTASLLNITRVTRTSVSTKNGWGKFHISCLKSGSKVEANERVVSKSSQGSGWSLWSVINNNTQVCAYGIP